MVRCSLPSEKSQSSHFHIWIQLHYWSVSDSLSYIDAKYISALLNSGTETIWALQHIWCSEWPLEHAYESWLTRGRTLCIWKDNTSCSVVFTNRCINGTNKGQWNVCSFTERPCIVVWERSRLIYIVTQCRYYLSIPANSSLSRIFVSVQLSIWELIVSKEKIFLVWKKLSSKK